MPNTFPSTILPTGTVAPDFSLQSTPDQSVGLAELRGSPVILAFYPADWSPVCSDELAILNVALPEFKKYSARLLAISVDNVWSHIAFAQSRNFHFSLLADFYPHGEVSKIYGVFNEKTGESKRALFVVDKNGVIAWSYLSPEGINPGADGILQTLERLT